jgi:glycine cleavage system H protein
MEIIIILPTPMFEYPHRFPKLKKDKVLCFVFTPKIWILSELKFTKEHEWIRIEKEEGKEIAIIGISNFAQDQLGEIVSIELPKAGGVFKQGQTIAIVDSVKASSDIYTPISGEIVGVNEELIEKPELVNQSPYELGWIAKIKPSNTVEFESLMTKEKYDRYIGEIK